MNERKPIIAIDVSSSHRGGPYISSYNLMNSNLKYDYDFRKVEYNTSLGRGISYKRIVHLYKQIKSIAPDAILVTGLQLSCFHVLIAAILAGVKKRIVVIHGSSLEAISFSNIKKRIMYIIEYLSLLMCTAFYGVSKYASTLSATKFFKKKNRGFVYNIPSIKIPTAKVSRNDYGFTPKDIIIATSGRITREKGFSYLADAIASIQNPQIKFIVIGDGNYLTEMRRSLLSKVKDGKVVFTGFVDNVVDIVNCCDIFILPTLHETLSVSLLEAASLSKPLISCNVGGVPEVIEDGYNGILVTPADSTALRQAIIRLADDKSLRETMGRNSLRRVETVFSTASIVKKMHNIFKQELEK